MDCTLFEKVRDIIVRQTGLSPEDITPTSALSDHEGIDSLDQVEIIMDIEDTFGISIPDEVAQKMTYISEILKYLEVVIRERDEADRELDGGIQRLEEVGEDGSCSVEQMRLEASSRLSQLVTALGLNLKVVNYWEEGRLYYSYLTAGGFMGSIDKIEHDSRYVDIVKQFEQEYNLLVYHVIESGRALILLWVGNDSDEWEYERLDDNVIMSYVYCLDDPSQSDFGDVELSSLHGALIRIG